MELLGSFRYSHVMEKPKQTFCPAQYKPWVGPRGMKAVIVGLESCYLAQALVFCHLCVCFTPREILHLLSMASLNPYGDPLS